MAKKKETKVAMTRAQKTEATKGLIKELLSVKPLRHNELIDETAKLYIQRFKGEDTENVNDVRGRAGSVLDIMQKESDVMYDGGMYALKARILVPVPAQTVEEKPKKGKAKKTDKAEETLKAEMLTEPQTEQVPAPKKRGRKPKTEKPVVTKLTPPTVEEDQEEKPAILPEETPVSKKRGRKVKAKEEPSKTQEAKAEPVKEEQPAIEQPVIVYSEAKEEPKKEETALAVKSKAEIAPKGVMDMSFLFGTKNKPVKEENTPAKSQPKTQEKVEKQATVSAVKTEEPQKPQAVKEEAKAPKKAEKKLAVKQPTKVMQPKQKPLSAEEKLREAYLKRMRALGGDYFEYYSMYLLERYSMRNGRRLEGMKISGGDHDGGIDGEIELTDRLGFRETIYIQSKNWDPEKGKEENWVVGETLLQQFIGACACRQAKDRKLSHGAQGLIKDKNDKHCCMHKEDFYVFSSFPFQV